MTFTVQALSEATWPAFADLVERHGGIWGGCWCMEFHPDGKLRDAQRRERKAAPDWRITCFFVDKAHCGRGVAATALAGALELIAQRGGGTVESQPEDVSDRQVSASFLYNSRLAMFEHQGFQRMAQLGQHHWLVSRHVAPA